MSKRKIIDPVTKAILDVKRTPSASRGVGRAAKKQKYFKRNYLDVIKIITPNVYWDDDIALSGMEVGALDQLINSNMVAANSSEVISISALGNVSYLSAVDSVTGLQQYFIKQNNLSWLTPQGFENKILLPLKEVGGGSSMNDFDTSSEFLTYLSGNLLPKIVVERGDGAVGENLASNTVSAFATDGSGTHKHLVDKLSWAYFLNASDPAGSEVRPPGYATSGEVAKLLTEHLWTGQVIDLEAFMKLFQKYLWSNYASFSSIDEQIIPQKYRVSGTAGSATSGTSEFVSGTQLRDRLETLAGVVYAGQYFDDKDRKIQESFQNYIASGATVSALEAAGPFTRFMQALGFSFADRSGEAQEIETLLDIDSCPDEMLPYLADLIGWTLLGPDASRRRNQIRQAVAMYKAKGTKRSVQFVSDSLFGTSGFNVVDNQLYDLWESYIPNLIFYTLTTSCALTTNGLESFTRQDAINLGLDTYFETNLDENVRVAVDRIMWELMSEFPNNFIFGGKPYPRPTFYYANDPTSPGTIPYDGPWVRYPNGYYFTAPGPNAAGGNIPDGGAAPPIFSDPIPGGIPTVTNWELGDSFQIIPVVPDGFEFFYRGRLLPFPPWEEIKYYQECTISRRLINALKNKLLCFKCDPDFVDEIINYISTNTVAKEDIEYSTNAFLFFTDSEQLAPNYDNIISVETARGNELVKYLPYWNSKSSHFKLKFSASSFDFTVEGLDTEAGTAITKVKSIVNTAAPAHAIPEILLDLSSFDDVRLKLDSEACPKARFPVSSLVAGPDTSSTAASSDAFANYSVSTVNPRVVLPEALHNKFRRADADSLNDALFASGSYQVSDIGDDVFFSAAPRNTLRRRNFKNLIPNEEIDLRDGIGSPGFNFNWIDKQLSPIYGADGGDPSGAFATSGVYSLGFNPSTLSYQGVALKKDPFGIGNILDVVNIHEVWNRCQNYSSSDKFFDIQVSSTFPYRGYTSPSSNECSGFFSRRAPLNNLLALMHRVSYYDRMCEASSLVSGYYLGDGSINPTWPVSSSKLDPVSFSSWYEYDSGWKNVVLSIANHLEETTSATLSINYMEDFSFGIKLHKFYRDWLENYGREALNFNYTSEVTYNPSILSHTYGPYLFNSDFELTASSVDDVAPSLVASTVVGPTAIVDISFGGGRGVLSQDNAFGVTNITASDASSMYVWNPEIRNDTLLSGLEFVDTSNPYELLAGPDSIPKYIPPNPTFGLIKVADSNNVDSGEGLQSSPWSYNRTLEDNLVIKYSRNYTNALPRLRYKIEPDSLRADIKNFLVPDCEYTFNVKAANLYNDFSLIGGSTLKAWIHTEPLGYTYRTAQGEYTTEQSIWSFNENGWERTPISILESYTGFFYVEWNSLAQTFTLKPPQVLQTVGVTNDILVGDTRSPYTGEIIVPYDLPPRLDCAEAAIDIQQKSVNEILFETLSYDFNTDNSLVVQHPNNEKLHTKNRKYYIEIFLQQMDRNSYVIFENINMQNKTFKDKAMIQAPHCQYELPREGLKTCFDYFNDLARSSLASRNSTLTSGTLEPSGGGRLSYRENVNRSNWTQWNSNFRQVTDLIIEG